MLAREDLFNKTLEERIGKYHRIAEELSRQKEQLMDQLLQRHEVRTPLPIPGGGRTPRAEQSCWRDWHSQAGVRLLRPGRVNVSGIFCAIWPHLGSLKLSAMGTWTAGKSASPAHLGSHLPTQRASCETFRAQLNILRAWWERRSEKRLAASVKG